MVSACSRCAVFLLGWLLFFVVTLPLERTILQNVIVCVAYKGHRTKGVCKPGVWWWCLGGPLSLSPEVQRESYQQSRKGVQMKRAWS